LFFLCKKFSRIWGHDIVSGFSRIWGHDIVSEFSRIWGHDIVSEFSRIWGQRHCFRKSEEALKTRRLHGISNFKK
jgi:hypothetical protein